MAKSITTLNVWLIGLSIATAFVMQPVNAAEPGGFKASSSSVSDTSSLFPEPLFPDDDDSNSVEAASQKFRSALHGDVQRVEASANSSQDVDSTIDRKIAMGQVDSMMRSQMEKVAHWLQLYGVRNRGEFPGVDEYGMDKMYAAQVQLTELCPNNPYAFGPTQVQNWGIPSSFNPNGSAATASPVWNDQWNQHLQAQTMNRIQLQNDLSLTPGIIDSYADNPPQDWQAAPGTITAVGNNQGIFYVWGAGADGKPIKNPMNGKTYIVSGSTYASVNDQSAPNQY